MSGIAGIWHRDGRSVTRADLAPLSAALAHRGEAEGCWLEGPVGLACRLRRTTPEARLEQQPAVAARGVVVFDGRLDNRAELLQALSLGPATVADPDLLLAAWTAWGEEMLPRLLGDFALALWDPHARRLVLARDSLGVRPLYYVERPGWVAFASEIKALLARPEVHARPDDAYLAALLWGDLRGYEARTGFAGVASVAPSSVVTVSADRLVRRRYWEFTPPAAPPVRSFPAAVAGFREYFEQAVRRRLRSAGPVAVSLSGGLDSSAVFCVARRTELPGALRPPVVGVSYVPPEGSDADERAFLAEIERQEGVRIVRVPARSSGLLASWPDAVALAEAPFVDEQWPTTVAHLDAVRKAGCRVLLTGHWGDEVLFDQAYLVDLVRAFRWGRAWRDLWEFGRWYADCPAAVFWRRWFLDTLKWTLPARVAARLRGLRRRLARPGWWGPRLASAARPVPVERGPVRASAHWRALHEQVRSAYHVLCLEWHNKVAAAHGLDVAFPFLDRDLLEFVMALPGELVSWQGVPKALLRAGLRDVLPRALADRRWKADFTALVNAAVAQEFHAAMERVGGGLAVTLGYVDPAALRAAEDALRRGLAGPEAATAWRVAEVVGLELWLERFFGGTLGVASPTPAEVAGGIP